MIVGMPVDNFVPLTMTTREPAVRRDWWTQKSAGTQSVPAEVTCDELACFDVTGIHVDG